MIASRVAHYEVVEKLGSGGMGDVYRGRDLKLGRDVAIKFLPARFSADRMRLARFEQEARAASALNHPNLVTVHDVDRTEDGHPFIVMELVKGRTLRELLTPGRPLVTRRALELAAQATEGLAKAHAAGIVHRDLKPENLMITEDGFVKILDFGLAKLIVSDADSQADTAEHPAQDSRTEDGLSPQTGAGVVLGTTGYMSPEQARGRPVDYRADQFSCGAILYEMATGLRAFRRETSAQTLAAIIEDDPEPIASLNPRCPPPFRWIIERCLKKDPDERYASTLDLARELRTVCDRLEETSAPSGAAPILLARGLRRNAIAAAVGAALLAAAGTALWQPVSAWIASRRVPAEKHVAVLPFQVDGDEPAGRAFCDGIVETLASKLTRLEGVGESFWVVPMSEVRAAGVASAAAARRAFGVTLVVTGSAQLVKERVRVTANLVDARTLRQVRSTAPLDMPLSDAALLQDSLVGAVAGLLDLEPDRASRRLLAQGGTQVAGAYEHYLLGRGHLVRYDSAQSLDLAIGAFQQAIQQDPRFALAYAGLGEAYWKQYELLSRPESVELAQKACRRALEINDLLAPVHVTLGILATGTGQAQAAEAHFRRALDLEPASADAQLGLATALEAGGRASEAEAVYRSALERRPSFWGGHSMLGTFYYKQGRYADAEHEFRRVVELLPESPRAYNSLGGLYHLMGRTGEAIAMLEKSLAVGPTPNAASNLATVRFFSGDYTGAARAFEQVVTLRPADFWLWFNLASAYYWAPGERQKAEETYRKAADLGEHARAINPRDAEQLAALAETYGHLGREQKARERVGEALRLAPLDGRVLFRAACLFEKLGERDRSLALVRRALANGYSTEEVARSPDLEGLRADPRFKG